MRRACGRNVTVNESVCFILGYREKIAREQDSKRADREGGHFGFYNRVRLL